MESFEQFRLAENCFRNYFVFVKFVINTKNNTCIPQTICKTLFSYCSGVVEIFQQFKHLENRVRNFFSTQ